MLITPVDGVDFADDVVVAVGDEEVSRGVYGDVHGIVEFGAGGRPAVAAIAPAPFPATVVIRPVDASTSRTALLNAVGDEEISGGIHRHGRGIVELARWWPLRRRRCSRQVPFPATVADHGPWRGRPRGRRCWSCRR